MNKKLMEILENIKIGEEYDNYDILLKDYDEDIIREAHDQIMELWKECLPKKEANTEVSEYYSGFNKAITQAQKNMEG